MRKTFVCLCALALAVSTPAEASTAASIVGLARAADGQCLTINGATTTGRSRWLTGYWSQTSTPVGCLDTDPHFDPTIICMEVETSGTADDRVAIAYIGATGPQKASYLIKIIDRTNGTDEFGVQAVDPGDGPCGAAGVRTVEAVSGGFTVAGA